MKHLRYDAFRLKKILLERGVSYKDAIPAGELILFLQSDRAIFRDSDFDRAISFMKTTAIKRLLNRLDRKILNIIHHDEDTRVRVIEWTIDWVDLLYEVCE